MPFVLCLLSFSFLLLPFAFYLLSFAFCLLSFIFSLNAQFSWFSSPPLQFSHSQYHSQTCVLFTLAGFACGCRAEWLIANKNVTNVTNWIFACFMLLTYFLIHIFYVLFNILFLLLLTAILIPCKRFKVLCKSHRSTLHLPYSLYSIIFTF